MEAKEARQKAKERLFASMYADWRRRAQDMHVCFDDHVTVRRAIKYNCIMTMLVSACSAQQHTQYVRVCGGVVD